MTRALIVDPSAYTPPYDHALCAALARQGADVELLTSEFAYGEVPAPVGYRRSLHFYRHARGAPGSRLRLVTKLAEHGNDMLRLRHLARSADVVHFQWLAVAPLDLTLLPRRPLVLTAHDLLPREPRPGQVAAQRRLLRRMDGVVVHSAYGRERLLEATGVDPALVHVVPHGAFSHLASLTPAPLPRELSKRGPVALFFGLLRPYKGLDVLLDAWRGIADGGGPGGVPELWVVGRPRVDLAALRAAAPGEVRFVPRFVADPELAAVFRAADLVVLPYRSTDRFDASGVLAAALAFGRPLVLSAVGGFAEVAATGAATLVPPGDPDALREVLAALLSDPERRARMGAAAVAAAAGPFSWTEAARRTLAVYDAVKTGESSA